LVAAGQGPAGGSDSRSSPEERQRQWISVLQSDAPLQDKAITCKQLAIYGTKDAVPALAALLSDESLASWARIAIEAIPGPAADEALREAMGRLQGMLLIGTINSIGNRRDPQAVNGLAKRLGDANLDVASAAARALGRVGGEQAAEVLERSLAHAPVGIRQAVAEGCILCAERFLEEGKPAEAVTLYDAVRQADVPMQRLLEATRGAILARHSAGFPLLVEQLRSADGARFGIGLRTARELPGREVTETLAVELDRLSPERQALLLLALADRSDAAVLPVVLRVARAGPKEPRTVAVSALERLGNASCIPVLLEAAVEGDTELAQAAETTLARLPGTDVDADLLGCLPQATGKVRQVLIEVAGQRRMGGALPWIVVSAEDADPGIRAAAIQAIGTLGEAKQTADLVRLLQKAGGPKERADIEKALLAISDRCGVDCLRDLLHLMQSGDSDFRMIGLHALATIGGPGALAAIESALNDKEENIQDEAVRALSTWPNKWPEDSSVAKALLTLAWSDQRMLHQVLGLRGYLQSVRGDKKLNGDEKAARVSELLPLIKRSEEKRLAIAVIGDIPTARALELLLTLMMDPLVVEEACAAIVKVAGKDVPGVSGEQRRKTIQSVVERSKNDAIKRRAEEVLQGIH